jgi:hypothetical protein
MRPYLAITILQRRNSKFEQEKFLERYIKAITSNPTSILYVELAAAETISEERWAIPESCRLLGYFFGDIKVAEALGIWKPVGNIAVRHIKDLKADPENDPITARSGISTGLTVAARLYRPSSISSTSWSAKLSARA